jgi:hypothetical protein
VKTAMKSVVVTESYREYGGEQQQARPEYGQATHLGFQSDFRIWLGSANSATVFRIVGSNGSGEVTYFCFHFRRKESAVILRMNSGP